MASEERTISSSLPVHCFESFDVILNTTSSECRVRWGLKVKYFLSLYNIGILQDFQKRFWGKLGKNKRLILPVRNREMPYDFT